MDKKQLLTNFKTALQDNSYSVEDIKRISNIIEKLLKNYRVIPVVFKTNERLYRVNYKIFDTSKNLWIRTKDVVPAKNGGEAKAKILNLHPGCVVTSSWWTGE